MFRLVAAAVFTLARNWICRLPERERLALASVGYETEQPRWGAAADIAAGAGRDTGPDGEVDQDEVDRRAWQSTTVALHDAALSADRVASVIGMAAGDRLSLDDLAQTVRSTACDLREAAVLTNNLAQQGSLVGSVAPMALDPGVDRAVTLVHLREARQLGPVRRLENDMRRRAGLASHRADGASARWRARWCPDGIFATTRLAPRPGEIAWVEGWAAHPEVIDDVLTGWVPGPVHVLQWEGGGQPSAPVQLPSPELPGAACATVMASFWADTSRREHTVARIHQLRQQWSDDEQVSAAVGAAAAQLQAEEPQLPDVVRDLSEQDSFWGYSQTAMWVPTRSIVCTPDPEMWGEFDRSEPERRSGWVQARARELLAAPDTAAFLAQHLAVGEGDGPIELEQIPGPAGPLHVVGSGGTHRVHLARILGLPFTFAVVTAVAVPRRINSLGFEVQDMAGADELASSWVALDRHGLLHGDYELRGSVAHLRLDAIAALWWLFPARHAAAYNQRYELLHPGALTEAGVPAAALASASAWRAWLLHDLATEHDPK